jgi:hypothetical protein
MMNDKTLGLVRELLASISAALIAYGIGSDAIWQEVSGGLLALVSLIWGVSTNTGAEAWFSMIRKVLSAVAGVSVLTGVLAADKAAVLLGAMLSMATLFWSLYGKLHS